MTSFKRISENVKLENWTINFKLGLHVLWLENQILNIRLIMF